MQLVCAHTKEYTNYAEWMEKEKKKSAELLIFKQTFVVGQS